MIAPPQRRGPHIASVALLFLDISTKMFGKFFKALVLVQLVVLATLAPIVLAMNEPDRAPAMYQPGRVYTNLELDRAYRRWLDQYWPSDHEAIKADRGSLMPIPGLSAPAYINPIRIARYHAISVPSRSFERNAVEHMKQHSNAFFVEHPNGEVRFYSKDLAGEFSVKTMGEGASRDGIRQALHRKGVETFILPKAAEVEGKAESSLGMIRKILKRDFGGVSIGRGGPLPTIHEDFLLKDGSQFNRLQRQLAIARGFQPTKPILNPVNIGNRFLAVKLPQNSWDNHVIERMKEYRKPFFVEGKGGAVQYYYTKDGSVFTQQDIPKVEKEIARDLISAHGGTVVTPDFKYVKPATAGVSSEAVSGGSWISRMADRWFGGLKKGVKYLRTP